ncbi:uncharacterized protein LOC118732648 isoform X1 [Rhagoletis pomonella]|uniref:uncharacterized protein LOC118732648 isoform X1 n=1 Tax=Rhagoletis pomonella TaxID=28610 RepID=UPI00177CA4B6|nr:uncharacterized protein LOC118732648 isoform X1 [Rhagoletis pomonella]
MKYIWNHMLPSYKHKYKKQQFLLALVDEMNSTFTANVPFQYDEVTHKWCNIKSYFSSEKQRMDKAKRSGAGGDENVQTSWKFYEALKFLQHVNEHTPSVNNFNKWSLQNLDPDPNTSRKLGEQLQPAECFDPGFDSESSFSLIEDNTEFITITPLAITSNSSIQSLQDTKNISTEDTNSDATPIKIISDEIVTPPLVTSQNCGRFDDNNNNSTRKLVHATRKRRTKINNDLDENAYALIEASQNLTNAFHVASKTNNADEKANSFGIYMGEEIVKLDPDLQLKAKKQMHDILMDLQSEQLKRNGLM